MSLSRLPLLIFMMTLFLSACSGSTETSGDGRTSGEVLSTAQAKAEATRQATFQTPPPTPIPPSPTMPLITDTPAPSVTPTPSQPIAIADYNAYVREGPDEAYANVDFFLEGQSAIIVGRFENETNGTWWYIERIDEGKNGWVWDGAVTTSGDVNAVPLLEAPPL